MDLVDLILEKGLEWIHDIVSYYTMKLQQDDEVQDKYDNLRKEGEVAEGDPDTFTEEYENSRGESDDEEGYSNTCFLEMLRELDEPSEVQEGTPSPQIQIIQQWDVLQFPLPWQKICKDISEAVWHTVYYCYHEWHTSIKHKGGSDKDEYVDHDSTSKHTHKVSVCLITIPRLQLWFYRLLQVLKQRMNNSRVG